MKEQLQELFAMGMEKYAQDETKAAAFVEGFVKEASSYFAGPGASSVGQVFTGMLHSPGFAEGMHKAVGTGIGALALGFGVHGLSTMLAGANTQALKSKFDKAFSEVTAHNPIVQNAEPSKVRSYAETIFKFAPHVACDANLLSSILANAVHGEGIDPMTIRTLADLEGRLVESKKAANFSPKAYV